MFKTQLAIAAETAAAATVGGMTTATTSMTSAAAGALNRLASLSWKKQKLNNCKMQRRQGSSGSIDSGSGGGSSGDDVMDEGGGPEVLAASYPIQSAVCVICRQVLSSACCDCFYSQQQQQQQSNNNNNKQQSGNSQAESTTTFPSNKAASVQSCNCCCSATAPQQEQQQQQQQNVIAACCCNCCDHRGDVVSTNDNNQKVNGTRTETNCSNNNINKRLQQYLNIYSNCLNILRTLQLLLLFVQLRVLPYCCNAVFKRRRRQQQQHQQQQQQQQQLTKFLSLPSDNAFAATLTRRLSPSRNNYNNSTHNQLATSNCATSQRVRVRVHHKSRRCQHYQNYQHYSQQQPQQQRQRPASFSRNFFIALLVISFLTTTLPAIHATTTLQLQQQRQQQPTTMQQRNFGDSLDALTSAPRLRRAAGLPNNVGNEVKLTRNESTCKSMDIRNNATEFKMLSNCTIIEGFLLITLINDAHNINHSYPLLTEVTEYIIVYRVNNLLSLSKIFPNLSVIRGNLLFDGYALVVYQNRDLQDLGLSKLKAIANGGVRIEKNLSLCFVKTVDWSQIVSKNTTETDIVLKFNRYDNECPKCPGELKGGDSDTNALGVDAVSCKEYPDRKRYCWSSKACQIICPERCRNNCIDETTCCNEACLGGCSIGQSGQDDCTSCRHFSIHNNTCVDRCPHGFFRYGRRCITASMCERIGTKYESTKELPLLHFEGQCTTRCPKGYMVQNSTCVRCFDKCEKNCEGGTIDSFVRAKEFHGCTKIGEKEGLIISIKRGGPHMKEALEFGLGAVHTINTYLKVHLTYGLFSLSFFKSLRQILGKHRLEGRYVLYVLENNDLEAIWATNQSVFINGSVFFHFNPKLCYATIDALRPSLAANLTEFNKNEVASDSNGNKGSCNTVKLDVRVKAITQSLALVEVNNASITFADERAFIGYQYFVMADPYGNATKQSYKPCEDNWEVSNPTKEYKFFYTNLIPYTQYAYYVRTMTISSEPLNGQSEIQYLTTNPSQPTYVRRVKARSNSSSEIVLSWDPPENVYGKLTMYMVRAVLTHRDAKMEQQRNYCRDPLTKTYNEDAFSPRPGLEKKPQKQPLAADDADCKCEAGSRKGSSGGNFDQQVVESSRQDEIEFENTLQNFLYVRNDKKSTSTIATGQGPAKTAGLAGLRDNSIGGGDATDNALVRRRRHLPELEDDDDEVGSVLLRHIRAAEDGDDSNRSSMVDWPPANQDPLSWINETRRDPEDEYYEVFVAAVQPNMTQFVFTELRHFTLYTLSVVACRESIPKDKQELCSVANPVDKITNKLEHVDKAQHLKALLESTNSTRANVRLRWDPPEQPNGAIVSYTISYELQAQDAVEEKKCITEQDYRNLTNGYVLTSLNEGNYSVRVRANSLAGEGEYTDSVYVYVPPPRVPGYIIAIIVVVVGGIIVLASLASYMYFTHKKSMPMDLIMNPTVNPFYVSLQYVPDDWEVPRERIIQLRPLGQGSFGMVYEGILKGHQNAGEDTPCAIKTVNENATDRERTNFLTEASVMKEFDTYHVVRLLGVCSRGQPALVVMELMKNGDLKTYLRAHRPDERDDAIVGYQQRLKETGGGGAGVQPPPYSRIYQMAIEIADGMAYLAAKKFVHRDLAARNCMVAADLTVKIGDFGMTRDIYETDYYRKGTKGLLPVRWMPPESLRDGVYASSSDVFSFGVVLWEMATLASQPYQGLSNEQVLRYVIDGGVMERPENCPDLLYTLMQSCWHHRPSARPSFLDIIVILEHLSDPHFKEVAFYYSDAGLQYREKERKDKGHTAGVDVYSGDAMDADAEDATTPLRVGEFSGYKSNMEHNSSVEQHAESPINIDEEQPHSPFSMHSGYIVSSTPDRQSKGSYNLSHTNPTLMSSAPSTSVGGGGPRPFYGGRTATISQGDEDAAAYVLPDSDVLAGGNSQGRDDRGYEMYDPSPNFPKLPSYERSELEELPTSGHGGGKLSGEQHLLPRLKRGTPAPTIMPMSSSMPDDTGAAMCSSLQPSTASAASSNASSNTGTGQSSRYPSLKRVVADTLRNRTGALLNRHFFNHKRSGSNASHKSTGSNPQSSSSNTNLTSGGSGGGGKSLSGQNLGTIESGGSGSAGSYAGTPRFFTAVATPTSSGNEATATAAPTISDNPNYQLLDESANSSAFAPPPAKSSKSSNSICNLLDELATVAPPTTSVNPNYEMMQPPLSASDNPNYVLMSEPSRGLYDSPRATDLPAGQFISENPNYQIMLPNWPQQQRRSSASSEDESDENVDDEHTEHIKMERMPLSRQKQRGRSKSQQQRSRSASQTRRTEAGVGLGAAPGAAPATSTAASASNASNILKENWLRQASTSRPPPPNGFIGREA